MSNESSKPRTWWIVNWGGMNQDHSLEAKKQKMGFVHFVDQYEVIDKSTYDQALERIKLLEEVCGELFDKLEQVIELEKIWTSRSSYREPLASDIKNEIKETLESAKKKLEE